MKDLKGKVAAVTGAASGLGRSMALAFAAEGMDVALGDVDETNLSLVEKEVNATGVRSAALRVDVSRAQDVEAFRDLALERLGGIHLVCNNAGVSPLGAAQRMQSCASRRRRKPMRERSGSRAMI